MDGQSWPLKINFKTLLIFTFFGGKQKPWIVWKCVKEWHSIIWFRSYFQNAKNIGQQKLFVGFLISVAWTYPKLPIMLSSSQKNLIIRYHGQEILIKRVGPTQWHGNYNLSVLDFEDIVLLTKNIDEGVDQICPPQCRKVKICTLNFEILLLSRLKFLSPIPLNKPNTISKSKSKRTYINNKTIDIIFHLMLCSTMCFKVS
jgi:hypothetical protein